MVCEKALYPHGLGNIVLLLGKEFGEAAVEVIKELVNLEAVKRRLLII